MKSRNRSSSCFTIDLVLFLFWHGSLLNIEIIGRTTFCVKQIIFNGLDSLICGFEYVNIISTYDREQGVSPAD
jgi:hypothetical protein